MRPFQTQTARSTRFAIWSRPRPARLGFRSSQAGKWFHDLCNVPGKLKHEWNILQVVRHAKIGVLGKIPCKPGWPVAGASFGPTPFRSSGGFKKKVVFAIKISITEVVDAVSFELIVTSVEITTACWSNWQLKELWSKLLHCHVLPHEVHVHDSNCAYPCCYNRKLCCWCNYGIISQWQGSQFVEFLSCSW